MRLKVRVVGLSVLCLFLYSCAVFSLPQKDRSLVFCDDFMTQYVGFYEESQRLMADKTIDVKTKTFIATKVNPKINQLHRFIVSYCRLATQGGNPSSTSIETTIAEISTLLTEVLR
jgi:hypothetical protein